MNIDANKKFKNNYRLQHIDTITGEILHDLEFHNVVLDQIIDAVSDKYYYHPDLGIAIGDGSGIPSASDTQLFHEIKKLKVETGKCSKKNDNTLLFSVSVTIPASASEVYDISEVGVCFLNGTLVTHALILDSEGNPIIVKKKDTDKIILNCELYVTFESEGLENFSIDNFVHLSSGAGTLVISNGFGAATSLEAQRISGYPSSTYNLPTKGWIRNK